MPIEYIPLIMISSLGALHGLALGIYLLMDKASKISNRLLGVLLIVLGIRISKSIFLYFASDLNFMIIIMGLSLVLIFGPLFFWYIKSLLVKDFSLYKTDFLHFLPFTIFFFINLLWAKSARPFYVYFGLYFIYLHFLGYIGMAYWLQRKTLNEAKDTISPVMKQWVCYLLIGMVFIWLSYVMFLLDELVPYIMGPITYSLVVYPLSFWGIKNKVITTIEKYKTSSVSSEDISLLADKLEAHMQSEKPYLDPDLKLPVLAAQLKISTNTLSQLINENFKVNFQQYVNTYRIKEAQIMLSDPANEHFTISAIALDCGFNSLSVFNTAFKKQTEITPSQYRKQQKA